MKCLPEDLVRLSGQRAGFGMSRLRFTNSGNPNSVEMSLQSIHYSTQMPSAKQEPPITAEASAATAASVHTS